MPVTPVPPVVDAHLSQVPVAASNAVPAKGAAPSLRELLPTLAQCSVSAVVLVQAGFGTIQARCLLEAARTSDGLVRGVVADVDLAAADAIPTLTRLSRDPLLKAVRLSLVGPAAAPRARDEGIARTLGALPRLGLRLDLLAGPAELPHAAALAQRHPDLALALEHAGLPDIAGGHEAAWLTPLRSLAALPRVRCKVSGLVRRAGVGWTIDTLRPWFDNLHALFGAPRLMWGSDGPDLAPAATYRSWHAATVALTQGWSADDRGALMGATARRFYGL